MAVRSIKQRLDQSRRVLDGWEALDRPSGKLEDLLEMISREIEALERLAIENEDWVVPAHYLIGRYRGFRKGLMKKAN
ncbi:MAG: hypothetical protein EOP18_05795 [Rhizobiaceae bacterium]|nr:MAG: hypothetical protein EOP18_05795 [Rhizobiaceae bacterium]